MFVVEGLNVLAISESKLKGKGWVQFGAVRGLVSGVNERVRAKEVVGLLLKDELWSCVIEYKYVSSRLMWVRLKVGNEKWVLVCA